MSIGESVDESFKDSDSKHCQTLKQPNQIIESEVVSQDKSRSPIKSGLSNVDKGH